MAKTPGLERPILDGRVNFPVCLAPMVGLSHVSLRALVRRYLPVGAYTLWPTEMLNSRRLPGETLGATPETQRLPEGEPGLVPQILGNDEPSIAESVRKLAEWGAEGIDINMGCPVQKALKHNYGVALMGDPVYAAEVVRMTVRHSPLPVSVKLRAGHQNDREYLLRFVGGLREAGASWICLHPRTAEQKRRGRADWSQIQWLRERIDIPVIGNGDIQIADDAERMLATTGCDMVMVGRALTARPWLLWQLGERWGWEAPPGFEGQKAPATPEEEGREYGRALYFLIEHMQSAFAPSLGLRRLRFFLRTSSVWLEYGHALTAAFSKVSSYEEALQITANFFESPHRMTAKTELRS